MTLQKDHIGSKIVRLREIKGIKQETLARELGVSQQAVSKMEQGKEVDDEKLEKVARILGVTSDEIKNYNEDAAVFHIQNMNDHSGIYHYHFNPIDKLVEAMENNKLLYERMLRDKDDIIKQKDDVIETYKRQQKAS